MYPAAEVAVDEALVRALLTQQFPDLAAEEIQLVGEGWDNFIFKVGPAHAVRLPRREAALPYLRNEQRWLAMLASRLPVSVPEPIYCGEPSALFPWPWSVVLWVSGSTADAHSFSRDDVALLVQTLKALHQPAPSDAPQSEFRGVAQSSRTANMEERLAQLARTDHERSRRCGEIWSAALAADQSTERLWLHGDLHPRNVLIREGSLVGIIDWGDVTSGDVATDVACAWLLIDHPQRRQEMLEAYSADRALRSRAMGWAAYVGLALEMSGEAQHIPLGREAIRRVIDDFQSQ